MKKVYLSGFQAEEGLLSLLESNQLELAQRLEDAQVILYKGSLEGLLKESSGKLKSAQAIIPQKMFLMNSGAEPIDLADQAKVASCDFENEDIRGVSEKIGALVDSLDNDAHFSDLARYMKLNAIELVQNALIFKRMSGKEGSVNLKIYETNVFYNICVTDPFGALSREDVLAKLARVCVEKTYENKESGAGLGLFMVLNASDTVIFRLKTRKETQVCCIINKYKRLKQFKNKSPALFVFNDGL